VKKSFFTGCALLLPVVITLVVAIWLIELFTGPLLKPSRALIVALFDDHWIFAWLHRPLAINIIARLVSFGLLLALLCLTGAISRLVGRHWLTRNVDRLFLAIPFVRQVYGSVRDVAHIMTREERPPELNKVFLAPFPLPDTYVLAVGTGIFNIHLPGQPSPRMATLLGMPVPIPHHGFVLIVPPAGYRSVDMTFEDALRFVVSAGMMVPNEVPKSP
jgi:uncharacterized membrane protein